MHELAAGALESPTPEPSRAMPTSSPSTRVLTTHPVSESSLEHGVSALPSPVHQRLSFIAHAAGPHPEAVQVADLRRLAMHDRASCIRSSSRTSGRGPDVRVPSVTAQLSRWCSDRQRRRASGCPPPRESLARSRPMDPISPARYSTRRSRNSIRSWTTLRGGSWRAGIRSRLYVPTVGLHSASPSGRAPSDRRTSRP